MSRFKELARIETAIKCAHKTDLVWADSYCATRIQIATRKDHKKYWLEIQQQVRNALAKAS